MRVSKMYDDSVGEYDEDDMNISELCFQYSHSPSYTLCLPLLPSSYTFDNSKTRVICNNNRDKSIFIT